MKRKVFLSVLLSLVLTFGLTACGGDAPSDSQQVSEKEEEGGFFDKLVDKKEDKEGYREDYSFIKVNLNEEAPEKSESVFVGVEDTFTISGFRNINNFYGGVAVAWNKNNEVVLIDRKGEQITQAGKYSRISRIFNNSDYYEVIDAETERYGVIDRTGKEIVPCEYDSISHSDRDDINDFICIGEKDGLLTVYSRDGRKIVDNLSEEENNIYYYQNGEYGLVEVYNDNASSRLFYSEKTGKLLFDNEQWFVNYIDPINRMLVIYDMSTDKEHMMLLNEDLSAYTEAIGWEGSTTVSMVDGQWLIINQLFNDKGELVFDFGMRAYGSRDKDGNTIFIGDGGDKCVIWDENCKEIDTIENIAYAYSSDYGYFGGYPIVDGSKSRTKNVYDLDGNLLYEDYMYFNEGGPGYYNNDGKRIVLYDMLTIEMSDGAVYIKTSEMDDFEKVPEGEVWNYSSMGYLTFKKGDELVIRDRSFKEVGKMSIDVKKDVFFGFYVETVDNVKKYYNAKGEFLLEIEQ